MIQISGKKLIKLFEKNGWKLVRSKGSHYTLVKKVENIKRIVTIPYSTQDIPPGTLSRIIKQQANMSMKAFEEMCKK